MIRRLIILLLIVGCGITKAQFINSYGLKLGIVNAKQDWSYSNYPSRDIMGNSITQLVLGGYFEHIINPKLSFLSGLEFMTKGAKSEELEVWGDDPADSPNNTITPTLHLDYLSIPIKIKYTHKYKNYSPYGLIGFKYDILINKKESALGGILENINNSEYCLTYGIGIMKDIEKYNVGLEIRNSYPINSAYSTDLLEIKNFTTDISLLIQP